MAESHQVGSLDCITKLYGENYRQWKDDMKAVLVLGDLWDLMYEDRPPVEQEELKRTWNRAQSDIKSIIHLACEPQQQHLIADAATGLEAWEILSDTYASSNMQNIVKLEERFRQAKKQPDQTIDQWIHYVKALAGQLSAGGTPVTSSHLYHKIMAGLGKEYSATTARLGSISRSLTREQAIEQLLAIESEMVGETKGSHIQSNSSSTTILASGAGDLPIASSSDPEIGIHEIRATKTKTDLIEWQPAIKHQTAIVTKSEIQGACSQVVSECNPKYQFNEQLCALIEIIQSRNPLPVGSVLAMLQQIESSIHQPMHQVDNAWTDLIYELLKYGARQFGTRYSKGARLWQAIMSLNKKLGNTQVKYNSVQSTPIRLGGVARLYNECLPYLMAALPGDEDSEAEKSAITMILKLLRQLKHPIHRLDSQEGRVPGIGLARFGFSLDTTILVVVMRNVTKDELGWQDSKDHRVVVVENPGMLLSGGDGVAFVSTTQEACPDFSTAEMDVLVSSAKMALQEDGQLHKQSRLRAHEPGIRGQLYEVPYLAPGRSISGLKMQEKGTYGLRLVSLNMELTGYALTAMHVVSSIPLDNKIIVEEAVRSPGGWDALSHLQKAYDSFNFERATFGAASQSTADRLRQALQHWTSPQIIGKRIAGWIGVDRFGLREDWALIKLNPSFNWESTTYSRWEIADIMSYVQKWGIELTSLQMHRFRDPEPGEVVIMDGATSGFTCGVVGAGKFLTYELASIWPEDPSRAPDMADTCAHLSIWPYKDYPFGVQRGDSGSAILAKSKEGGLDFVGLLVSLWEGEESEFIDTPQTHCGLIIPGTVVIRQLHDATNVMWRPA